MMEKRREEKRRGLWWYWLSLVVGKPWPLEHYVPNNSIHFERYTSSWICSNKLLIGSLPYSHFNFCLSLFFFCFSSFFQKLLIRNSIDNLNIIQLMKMLFLILIIIFLFFFKVKSIFSLFVYHNFHLYQIR